MNGIAGWMAYGKLPTQGDYVRIGANAALVAWVDAWSASVATQLAGAEGGEAFGKAAPACVLTPGDGAWLLSVWWPSGDAVGRAFPLVVTAPPRALVPAGDDPILALDMAMRWGGRLIHGLGNLAELTPDRLAQFLATPGVPPPLPENPWPALQRTTPPQFWQRQFGAADDARRYAVATVVERLQTQRPAILRLRPTPEPLHLHWWVELLTRSTTRRPALVAMHAATTTSTVGLSLVPRALDDRSMAAALWPGLIEAAAGRQEAELLQAPATTLPSPWSHIIDDSTTDMEQCLRQVLAQTQH